MLCQGIDQLSETLRTTLILVCIDGRSHEDVSAILGAPEGTIAWRIHEARRKLKEFLQRSGLRSRGRWDVSETPKKLNLDAVLREWPEHRENRDATGKKWPSGSTSAWASGERWCDRCLRLG